MTLNNTQIKDVLLPIGSIVEVADRNEDLIRYMIIGKRIINHESLRPWDYISIPVEEGMKREVKKSGEHFENFFYFNHYEIDGIISEFKHQEIKES